jgi:hypothetical protein
VKTGLAMTRAGINSVSFWDHTAYVVTLLCFVTEKREQFTNLVLTVEKVGQLQSP